jgi:hypothetical protein
MTTERNIYTIIQRLQSHVDQMSANPICYPYENKRIKIYQANEPVRYMKTRGNKRERRRTAALGT